MRRRDFIAAIGGAAIVRHGTQSQDREGIAVPTVTLLRATEVIE
jgi:hypothetical protein